VKFDRDQRMVGKVLAPDGSDVCLEMIRAGLAWWFRRYSRQQTVEERQVYEAAEVEARAAGRGPWADQEPVPPWEWRHSKRSER
jgi:endonuclease YncB( thermonuclease family)